MCCWPQFLAPLCIGTLALEWQLLPGGWALSHPLTESIWLPHMASFGRGIPADETTMLGLCTEAASRLYRCCSSL